MKISDKNYKVYSFESEKEVHSIIREYDAFNRLMQYKNGDVVYTQAISRYIFVVSFPKIESEDYNIDSLYPNSIEELLSDVTHRTYELDESMIETVLKNKEYYSAFPVGYRTEFLSYDLVSRCYNYMVSKVKAFIQKSYYIRDNKNNTFHESSKYFENLCKVDYDTVREIDTSLILDVIKDIKTGRYDSKEEYEYEFKSRENRNLFYEFMSEVERICPNIEVNSVEDVEEIITNISYLKRFGTLTYRGSVFFTKQSISRYKEIKSIKFKTITIK